MHHFFTTYVLASLILLGGCGGSDSDEKSNSEGTTGEALYLTRHTDANTLACAHCHALTEPTSDGITRPGHPIGDAANRASFKNGQLSSLLEAVNSCRDEWMAATTVWDGDNQDWQKLESYLKEQAEGGSSDLVVTEIAAVSTDLEGGDKSSGQSTFNTTCSICHGENAVGTEAGPALAGTELSPEAIAGRVRTSGSSSSDVYDGLTGGRMPFWASSRLSDNDLKNVIAYLDSTESTEPSEAADSDISLDGAQTNCDKTSPKIGKTANFVTRSHLVSGTVSIIDDCTLRLTNFNFDGGGIIVEAYTGLKRNFSQGRAISKNIKGQKLSGASVDIRLPSGVSMDDFDSLSIWCTDVSISFGDALFE